MFLLWFSGDDLEGVAPHGDGALGADFDDLLKDIDVLIGPEGANGQPDSQDTSTLDEQTLPVLSPIVEPREETRLVSQSRVRLLSRPTAPPSPPPKLQDPMTYQRKKKKSRVVRAWDKLKELFTKRLGGEDQVPPRLSDKLVPERDDEVKWYESLFSMPAKTRR